MKIFILLSLLGVSAFASFDEADYSILPAKIKCTTKNATSREVRSFEINDMDSDSPDATIIDASLLDVSLKKNTYEVSFSNQCDNSYSLKFKIADLVKFRQGKYSFVLGKLDYFDSWLYEAKGDDAKNEKISVFCTH